MANNKHKNTTAEKEKQKQRTHKNLKNKYEDLILNKPQDPHVHQWERKLTEIK